MIYMMVCGMMCLWYCNVFFIIYVFSPSSYLRLIFFFLLNIFATQIAGFKRNRLIFPLLTDSCFWTRKMSQVNTTKI